MTDIVPVPNWGGVRQLETNEYATGGLNGNMNDQAKSLAGQNMYSRLYAGLPFDPAFTAQVGGFPIGGRAALENGDIVKSTKPNNTTNPNTDMTDWVYSTSGYKNLNQFQINEVTKTLRNFNPDPTATNSSQLPVLDYLQSLPQNPAAIHSPKGYSNGGVMNIPRGRYLITEPIKLKRGVRICGESSESTQIISRSLTGVFVYEDDGGYVPDEVVLENISIWQDPDYTPTSGAALQVKEGEYTSAVMFILKNVMIEGTFKGLEAISGIGCSLDNVRILKTVSHGIDINNKGNNALSTTSTTLKNTYTFLCGGSGVNIQGSSYISILGGASDSNVGYGYSGVGANSFYLNGGAERNGLGNLYLKDLSSGIVQLHSIQHDGAGHGIVLNNANSLTLIGGGLYRSGTNTGTAIFFESAPKLVNAIGITNVGYTRETLTNNLTYINFSILSGTLSGGVVKGGSTNNWQFGNTVAFDTTTQLAIVGIAEAATFIGTRSSVTFTGVGSNYNAAKFSQALTASETVAKNYNLLVGSYIENASLGANTTVTRSAGKYIKEQTRGSTANANIMIDAGVGTVPAGNWSIYSDSTRPSYLKGPLSLKPLSSATPSNNGDLTFELTSDTQLKIKVRGSDGVVRSTTLTLA